MTQQVSTSDHALAAAAKSLTVNSHKRGQWILVAAVAENGVIGRGRDLPWRLRGDLQRFKLLTMGHCLLMGRKTYEAIGRRLPGRQTLVLSRQPFSHAMADAPLCRLEQVENLVEPGRAVMVVGGAEIYRATLADCTAIWLTRVLAEVEGDVFFPAIDWQQWQLQASESFAAGPNDQWPTEFQVWGRRSSKDP